MPRSARRDRAVAREAVVERRTMSAQGGGAGRQRGEQRHVCSTGRPLDDCHLVSRRGQGRPELGSVDRRQGVGQVCAPWSRRAECSCTEPAAWRRPSTLFLLTCRPRSSRPRHAARSSASTPASTPASRFAQGKSEGAEAQLSPSAAARRVPVSARALLSPCDSRTWPSTTYPARSAGIGRSCWAQTESIQERAQRTHRICQYRRRRL